MASDSLEKTSLGAAATRSKSDGNKLSHFRLGLFGDTRSGKTMYLTSIYDSADRGTLPKHINLKPQPGSSLAHLHNRLSMVRAGQWPPGDLDTELVALVVDYDNRKYGLQTKDFKGGDFGDFTEPKSRAEFERFVDELFKGCSAYVFLVDPGVLKQTLEPSDSPNEKRNREHAALRVKSGIQAALEMAGCTGWTSNLFHRPIAVVFTKCDLHPEISADPATFAAKYLDSTCRHLNSHAPRRHKYFAISSTGPVSQLANGEPVPPRPLRPENLTTPLTWCIDQHRKRHLLLKCTGFFVLLVLLVGCYAALYLHNANLLGLIRSQTATVNSHDLVELFHEADRLSRGTFSMWPTHPYEPERVRQAIATEALSRFMAIFNKHVDDNGVLREVTHYHDLDLQAEEFRRNYPGTAASEDLRVLLRKQRGLLAARLTKELENLAREGKETAFDDKQKQYSVVATSECDERVIDAREELNRRVARRKVSVLFDLRLSRPSDIDKILEEIAGLETEFENRKLAETDPLVKYVGGMRMLYDQLKKQGVNRSLYLTIRSKSDYKWQWSLHLNSWEAKAEIANSNGWVAPSDDPDPKNAGFFLVTSRKVNVDLFATKTLLFWLEEDTWGTNGTLSLELPLRTTAFGLPNGVTTTEGTMFWITIHDNSGIKKNLDELKTIEGLEDVIFRNQVIR